MGGKLTAMHLWLLFILGAVVSVESTAAGIEIRPGTKVEFASASTTARLLSVRDGFVQAMSPYDRSARLKTDHAVTEAEYLAFVARQAENWNADEKTRLIAILESFRAKAVQLGIRLPSSIFLLKTTGLEEGGAAYCRGVSIVIPETLADGDASQLESLVFHELFHIYRAHNPETRAALYGIIGFHLCPQVELPEGMRSRKITNPDAPLLDSFIRIRVDGRLVAAMPVLFAKTERYDTKAGGEFFRSMVFRLMVLDRTESGYRPSILPGGAARLLDPKEVPDYLEQVGRNTGYVIHPDEILADNFALMLGHPPQVASPRILQEMRSLLTK